MEGGGGEGEDEGEDEDEDDDGGRDGGPGEGEDESIGVHDTFDEEEGLADDYGDVDSEEDSNGSSDLDIGGISTGTVTGSLLTDIFAELHALVALLGHPTVREVLVLCIIVHALM